MAETVVADLEDRAQYQSLEAALYAQFRPRSTIQRELVARLTSLLWRLRRATSIETGLLEFQGRAVNERRRQLQRPPAGTDQRLAVLYKYLDPPSAVSSGMPEHSEPGSQTVETIRPATPNELAAQRLISRSDTALAFARVCNLNRAVFDRLGRYEVALWKQLSQTLVVLDLIRRENGRPLNNGSQLNGTVTHPKQQRNEHP